MKQSRKAGMADEAPEQTHSQSQLQELAAAASSGEAEQQDDSLSLIHDVSGSVRFSTNE